VFGAQLAEIAKLAVVAKLDVVARDAVPTSCGAVMLPVVVTLPEMVAAPFEISPFLIMNSFAIYLFPIQDYYLLINIRIGNKTHYF
jgi:hypothetical protein